VPDAVAIGPGAESVGVLLWAADPAAGRWDRASWDGARWSTPSWQTVGCDVLEAAAKWGSSQEAGILSIAEASELDLTTYDPARELDPLNTASPYYGAVKPGTPIRLVGYAPGEIVAATGYIDEISHDLASSRGRIRAIGGIAYLAQAQLAAGVSLPNTLRARVRAIVAAVGLSAITPVEPEAATDPDVDPAVAPHDGLARPAWQAIADAATDALWYVWADPTGMIRFRSWGALLDAPISLGCAPADADPGELWLEGLSTIETTAAGDAVRNSVRAYSSGTTWQPAATDPASVAVYGPRPFDVERVVPDFAGWSGKILADRADAGLDIAVGELRPYTQAELAAVLQTSLAGPSILRVRDDAHGELVDIDVGMIGARVGVTPRGWRFGLATLISRVAWDAITPEPPEPPIPPPDPWHVETRTYIATSDALLALTSGGAKYGAGAATSLPFGSWSGWTYRSVIAFPAIPWTKIRAVRTATLKLRTTNQIRIGFGSSPKATVLRITSAWSAGSSSSPSSSNAVVWPGPATTTSGAVTAALGTAENADKSVRVDALVRAWAPLSAGGSGAAQYGLELKEYSSSGSNTGEVYPVEAGGTPRPTLVLELEVFD
jgi:hypothetical protein